jgi:hypothetical protein
VRDEHYRRLDERQTDPPGQDLVLDRAWCADEVHCDFPAIPARVDRIRAGFVRDEPPLPLQAALRLTPREAVDGVTVPLDVPVRAACPLCGGRGESWMESCRACGGSGDAYFRHRVRLAVPAGVSDGARFAFRITAPSAVPTRVEVRVEIR